MNENTINNIVFYVFLVILVISLCLTNVYNNYYKYEYLKAQGITPAEAVQLDSGAEIKPDE